MFDWMFVSQIKIELWRWACFITEIGKVFEGARWHAAVWYEGRWRWKCQIVSQKAEYDLVVGKEVVVVVIVCQSTKRANVLVFFGWGGFGDRIDGIQKG